MADGVNKFKFVSPGVFVDEIDNSQLPAQAAPIGPIVIGRTAMGPAMRPVTVSSFSEFIEVFGAPVAGGGGGDLWRDGNFTAPTYASYAAQAWLRNNPTITMVRLLGEQDPDASVAGYAGWKVGTTDTDTANGGAWGLWVFPSSSADSFANFHQSGSLGAVFYCSAGRVALSGNDIAGTSTASICSFIKSDSNKEFTMSVLNSAGAESEKIKFNFTKTSDRYIRKVFNTNPTLTNTAITTTDAQKTYFLGESFESMIDGDFNKVTVTGSTADINSFFGVVLPMQNIRSQTQEMNDRRYGARKATTGVVFAQDLSIGFASYNLASQQQLFRFEALSAGRETQENIKISIMDIKASTNEADEYGTFSIVVRRLSDIDNAPMVLERFSSLNLNPSSPNYIAKVIGDKFYEYDATEKRNREYGQYDNRSRYIRVVMNEDVDRGVTDPILLPFGFFGPPKGRDVTYITGSSGWNDLGDIASVGSEGASVHTLIDGGGDFGNGTVPTHEGDQDIAKLIYIPVNADGDAESSFTGSFFFPTIPLRESTDWASPNSTKNVYWGAYTGRSYTDGKLNEDIKDMVRALPRGLESNDIVTTLDQASGSQTNASTSPLVHSFIFSLDNVGPTTGKEKAQEYGNGSRVAGNSWTAGAHLVNGAITRTDASASYKSVLDRGSDKFTMVMHGGADGVDITERDPFANRNFVGTDETANYELHTVKRAINVVRDPEEFEYNLLVLPGITNTTATQHLLDTAESRGDALAIIDLEKVYDSDVENTKSFKDRNAYTVDEAVNALRDRNINNSYGAAYYPWVRIQDTITGQSLWAPPSVVALGTLSRTDRVAGPWFAPAGFNRGGLSEGSAGLPVLNVSRRLTSDDRDDLYEANINPIAQFPAEGIVVFGQKTLQVSQSALDRINVRRLMIFVKREVSRIAARLLFEQNARATWNRFLGQAEPLLRSVQARFGLEDFRLILDESTTTPDLIDRNIIYAKCLLKPTRSVEFFAIDFVITNSGAGFDD